MKHQKKYNLVELGLVPGTVLQHVKNPNIICTVIEENLVDYNGAKSLSDAARDAYNLRYPINGWICWKHNSKLLAEIRQDKYDEDFLEDMKNIVKKYKK